MPNLVEQIREALSMFALAGTKPALIGGLAVVAHSVVRATQDVDFLLEAEAADMVHDALLKLSYQCVYRSEDAANYVRGTEGLDLLYAHRPLARRLLSQASERDTSMGRLRVVSVEGLIGFKLQGARRNGFWRGAGARSGCAIPPVAGQRRPLHRVAEPDGSSTNTVPRLASA
jgi:hypothetical protein